MNLSSRELILQRVRARPPAPVALPELPDFARAGRQPARPAQALAAFGAALARMGGSLVELPPGGTPGRFVAERFPQARVVCSATPELAGTRPIHEVGHPRELEDVDVGVVRAAFGVAETGSVWLSERELVVDALGYLPQHLVVLLDPAAIVADLHEAYAAAGFREARYAVLMTGPSATADIEGVLIRGAQGVRTLTVVALAAPPQAPAPAPGAAS